jgi:hypothetical protein
LRTPRRRGRAILVVILVIILKMMMERGEEFLGNSFLGSRRDKNKLVLLRSSESAESGVKD